MPELPEVELVVRNLRVHLAGKQFLRSKLIRSALAPNNTPRQFASGLRHAEVEEVWRRGKHILISFRNGRTLVVHLRMTGEFLFIPDNEALPAHTHALFELSDKRVLAFTDQRHFGYMELVHTAELLRLRALAELAPEPFSPEFSREYFREVIRGSRQPIKLLLLDQRKVLGLGNIYASEALFRAGINPKTPAGRLSRERAERLRQTAVEVLRSAIESNAGYNSDPEDISGSYTEGLAQDAALVYGREGSPCFTCESLIKRIVQGSRSTFYCPTCQRR